ncbi:unnamed protein product, partial [Musa acuminata subsp. burmannicoides]
KDFSFCLALTTPVQIALSHAPTATLKAVPFAEEQGGISLNLEMPFELSLKYHVYW